VRAQRPLSDGPRPQPHRLAGAGASLFSRALAPLLAILLLAAAALAFGNLAAYIQIPRPLTFPEGAVVYGAVQVASGEPLYADWRQWPHRFAPYGPLLYAPVGAWMAAAGAPPFAFAYYLAGRIQSLAALCAIALVLSGLARRLGCGWIAAAACGAGMTALWPTLLGYLASFRPDAPMLCFSLLAVWLALGDGLARPRRRWLILAALWIALLYKITAWSAPLVVGFIAWNTLGRRQAVRWAAVYLLGVALIFSLLHLVTGGYSTINILGSQLNGFTPPPFLTPAVSEWGLDRALVMLRIFGVLFLGAWLVLRNRHEPAARAIGLFSVLATLCAAIQGTKVGADINYLAEPFFLAAPLAGWVWSRVLNDPRSPGGRRAAATLALALLVLLPAWRGGRSYLDQWRRIRHVPPERFAVTRMDQLSPPVLLMDAAFTHPDPEAHAVPDPFHYALMVGHGRISPRPLSTRLSAGAYDFVALTAIARSALDAEPACVSVRAALEQAYDLKQQLAEIALWQRRATQPPAIDE